LQAGRITASAQQIVAAGGRKQTALLFKFRFDALFQFQPPIQPPGHAALAGLYKSTQLLQLPWLQWCHQQFEFLGAVGHHVNVGIAAVLRKQMFIQQQVEAQQLGLDENFVGVAQAHDQPHLIIQHLHLPDLQQRWNVLDLIAATTAQQHQQQEAQRHSRKRFKQLVHDAKFTRD